MRKILVIAAAGVALAIGVPKAFAGGDSPSSNAPSNAPIQNAQPERPNHDDCPEKDGGGSAAPSQGTTENPEI